MNADQVTSRDLAGAAMRNDDIDMHLWPMSETDDHPEAVTADEDGLL